MHGKLNRKGFLLTGIVALIYALIPALMDIISMYKFDIPHFLGIFLIFLILIALLNTGAYVLIQWYFNYVFIKVLFVIVSFFIFWYLFYRWYIKKCATGN